MVILFGFIPSERPFPVCREFHFYKIVLGLETSLCPEFVFTHGGLEIIPALFDSSG